MLRARKRVVFTVLIIILAVTAVLAVSMYGRARASASGGRVGYPLDLWMSGPSGTRSDGDSTAYGDQPVETPEEDEKSYLDDLPVKLAPTKPAATESQWKVIGKDEIWSVAWSPDGSRIAFVSVDERGDDLAIEGHDISRAVVWLMENPGNTGKVSFRKLARRTMEQRIPVGLFWLSEQEVGWAASAHYPEGFRLYAAGLSDGTIRPISNRRIGLHFVEHAGSEIWDGPGDLYFDPVSRRLFLTGDDDSDGQPVWIARYNPADDSLQKRRTSVTGSAGICAFTGTDGKTSVYLCGWEENPPAPKAYVWPDVSKSEEGVPQGVFIRVSPDGRTVSWIAGGGPGVSLVLYDVSRKTATIAAKWNDGTWMGSRGCPYSWSPDGRQIAYSDGKRIRIVQLTVKPSDRSD